MPILDAIPVNWFIVGTSVLAGVILFLILTQIPDEEEPSSAEDSGAAMPKVKSKKARRRG